MTQNQKPMKTHEKLVPWRFLGPVQVAILRSIERNPAEAYGAAITTELHESVGGELVDAQVYIALKRMESRGLVKGISESGGRRGRPRKVYSLTGSGRQALKQAEKIWSRS
jgi:DNA-binding PadR family transcriptional regulator